MQTTATCRFFEGFRASVPDSHGIHVVLCREKRTPKRTPHPSITYLCSRRLSCMIGVKDVPLPDLCAPDGWADPTTIPTCHEVDEPTTMRTALAARRPLLGEPPAAAPWRGHTPARPHLGTGD